MDIFWKCVPVVAVIATIAVGPGSASVTAQAHERIVVQFEGPISQTFPPAFPAQIKPHQEPYVSGFDVCNAGALFNLETGKSVGSIVECTLDLDADDDVPNIGKFGAQTYVQFFDLPGGSLVTRGTGLLALSFVPSFQIVTSIMPADTMLIESTGRFRNVRSGQVRLSGFVAAPFSDADCIFVIDLYGGKP